MKQNVTNKSSDDIFEQTENAERKVACCIFKNEKSTKPILSGEINWSDIVDRLHLEHDLRQIKSGPMLGCYELKPDGKRRNDDVSFRSAIQLDIDTEGTKDKKTGRIIEVTKIAPLLNDIRNAIDKYEWIAASSHWHEPQRGVIKYRITILPDRDIQQDEYKHLLEALDELLDGALDRSAWQWSQAFYLSSCPAENEEHAFFEHNTGTPLPVDEFLKRGGEILKKCNGEKLDKKDTYSITEAILGTPNERLEETAENIELIKSMLEMLSADCDRDTWLKIVFSIASLGWPCSEGIAREWSMTSDKYNKDSFDTLWGSFDPNRPGGITERTLFHMADEAGWTDPLKSKEQPDITRDDVEKCNPATNEGKALVAAYCLQERKKFYKKYGLILIEGQVAVIYREFNDDTGYVENKFAKAEAISKYHKNNKLPKIIETDGEARIEWCINIFEEWLRSHRRCSYEQPTFTPDPKLMASISLPQTGNSYNLYIGANFAGTKGGCRLILQHIHEVWCDGSDEAYQYVISWLARMIQQPAEHGRTVLVLRSGEGGGKNIILEIFDRYYGAHSAMLTKAEDLTGFNDHLGTAVFVFINEALWGGDKKAEGAVKSTITDPTFLLERKFVPKFRCRNRTHLVVATNNDWAVPVGIDDRRFFILDLNRTQRSRKKYFDPLLKEILGGGQEAFIYHLMHEVDISNFDVRTIPEINSSTKLDHKIRTADSITKWWVNVLTDGEFTYTREAGYRTDETTEWPDNAAIVVDKDEVYKSYIQSVRRGYVEEKSTVAKKMKELLDGNLSTARVRKKDGTRQNVFKLPTLTNAREMLDEHMGQHGPWHEVVCEDEEDE